MKKYGTIIIYGILLLIVALLVTNGFDFSEGPREINYKDFLTMVSEEKVKSVQVTQTMLYGLDIDTEITDEDFIKKGKYDFSLTIPSEQTFTSDINRIAAQKTGKQVDEITSEDYTFSVQFNQPPQRSFLETLLPFLIPMLMLGGVMYYLYRQQNGGKMANFSKSPAKMAKEGSTKTTFQDVAGADEEKQELQEVVEFLKNPKRFVEVGARIPKGILLVGPPGTGKTLLARATAGEAKVAFFSITGSDFVEMFVGVGASRVRDLFNTAKAAAPCVIFIDEIDAVGRHRGAGMGGGHDEREQTLNQLLVEMDGFSTHEGIIILAATNRPDILDPALLRPGRFDRQITVHYPDAKGREEILKIHARNKPLDAEVDLKAVALLTRGFTGADLENVLNEAAILTVRANKNKISMFEIRESITRVLLGPQKHSWEVSEKEQKITAYHEAGHAIVAMSLPGCDSLEEVSMIPRGKAGGYTLTRPQEEFNYYTKSKMLDMIAMTMGGRVAESIVFNDISTGASQDIKQASAIARSMVVEYGMSEKIGPMYLGNGEEVFIGRDFGHQRSYSDELAATIDSEVQKIINDQYETAMRILSKDVDGLHRAVNELLSKKHMTGEEFKASYENTAPKLAEPPAEEPPKRRAPAKKKPEAIQE